MSVYSDYLAYFPFSNLIEDDEEPIFQSSHLVKLTEISTVLKHVVDLKFLHAFHEPTIAFLYSSKQTFVGRLAVLKDTASVLMTSFDFVNKKYPILQRVDNLPYDSFQIISVEKPVGGILVISPNFIIHIDQNSSVLAVAVNSYASMSSKIAHKRIENLEINLEASKICFTNPSQFLITLKNGDL